MNFSKRTFVRAVVLTIALSCAIVSWTIQSAVAQNWNIPAYIQIRLNTVINDAVEQDNVIRKRADLNSIVSLLDHKNHHAASAAAYALGEIRNPEAVPSLISALYSGRPHMRRIAAHALGKIGDKRAVMPLIDVLSSGKQPLAVQVSAANALGRIGAPEAKVVLSRLNRSSQNWLHRTANAALSKINIDTEFKLALADAFAISR